MAKTGRKSKPTALHELHGTGHPTRMKARKNEPVATGSVGDAPPHLSADQKADWLYAVAHMPAGVAGAIDRWALEVFIVAADHHRIANVQQQKLDIDNALPLLTQSSTVLGADGKAKGGGNIMQSPYLGIISASGTRMLKAATELGFTPASRPRLESSIFDPAGGRARAPAASTPSPTPATRSERDLDNLMARRDEAVN